MHRSIARSTALAAVFCATTAVHAGVVLSLSELSSDNTDPAMLDATLTFSLVGDTLELTVRNDTPSGTGFDMDALFFNVSENVDTLELLTPIDGWRLAQDERADGFGTFDFALLSDQGNDLAEIAPQESVTFILDVQASAPAAEVDFTTQLSQIPPGNRPAVIAAKFVNGPGDDSAFGATVPEPATLLLTLTGLALLRRSRRRGPHAR